MQDKTKPAVDQHEPVQGQPLEIKVYGNNFDKAFKAFRSLVQKERILSTYKEKSAYEKPSERRRRKINEAQRKQLELDNPREKTSHRKIPKRIKPEDQE